MSLINSYDFICLLETFIIDITNFVRFFVDCDFFFKPAIKLSNHGRPSGGVLVLVKKSISTLLNVQDVYHDYENIVCLKLHFSCLNSVLNDVLLISTYLPPYSSPFYQYKNVDHGFLILDEFFLFLLNNYSNFDIILCGDLNARTKNLQPITNCESVTRFIDPNADNILYSKEMHESLNRKSKDSVYNTYGKYLYEFCYNFDLVILNGYCKGDNDGNFTFMSPSGQSVIDYFIVSTAFLNLDIDMKILYDITSWHFPITFKICLESYFNFDFESNIKENESITKIVWDESKENEFVSNIKSNFSDDVIAELISNVCFDVNDVVNTLSSMLLQSADCMKRTFKTNAFDKQISVKNRWFDEECMSFKKHVKNILKNTSPETSEQSKDIYIKNRNEYKSLLRYKKYMFSLNKLNTIKNLANKSSALFWSEIHSVIGGRKKSAINKNINIDQWFRHFKSVFQSEITLPPICSEDNIIYVNSENDLQHLNAPIDKTEVYNVLSCIKAGKSPGSDCITNNMLLLSKENINETLTSIFSVIFSNGIFINEWHKTIISPVFKKGNDLICSNYRPISLTSLLSKIYTSILNNRLKEYVTALDIIPEEQAAFRANFSTTDHIFTLYTLITKQFCQDRKLYVAFIDYRKMFDSVQREALFNVLRRYGINGNFLDSIVSLYSDVSAAVKCNGKISDYFNVPIGLKQGCVLSPLLFNIFISEVSKYINLEGMHGLQLVANENILHHLFYADDNCIFATTPRGLQSKLNTVYSTSLRLGLEVNLDKTKIIVFRKGGFLGKHEKWYYNNIPVEIVNEYNYLGITFSTKMSFTNASIPLIAKAKKSINEILFSLRSLSSSDLTVFCKLFDSKVFPILSYGCELWGIFENVDIERVHLYGLKRFLNVSLHCSNKKIYSETGRYPLIVNYKIRCVKYWLRIKNFNINRIVKQSYECLVKLTQKGKTNWVSLVRDTLCRNGYAVVWLTGEIGNKKLFFSLFKQTLIDNFFQDWNTNMVNDPHCALYYGFKPLIETELYLRNPNLKIHLRNALAKLRLGVSEINSHRFKFSLNNDLKKCPFCIVDCFEDEKHVLFVCPLYDQIRIKYLTNININSILNCNFRFNEFIKTNWFLISKLFHEIILLRRQTIKCRI